MKEFIICPKDFKQYKVRIQDNGKITINDSFSITYWLKYLFTSGYSIIYFFIISFFLFQDAPTQIILIPIFYISICFLFLSLINILICIGFNYEIQIHDNIVNKTKSFFYYSYSNEYKPIKYIAVEEGIRRGKIRICGVYGYSYMECITIVSYSNNRSNRQSAKSLIEKLNSIFEVKINHPSYG